MDYDFMFFMHSNMRRGAEPQPDPSNQPQNDGLDQQRKPKQQRELANLGPLAQNYPTSLRTRGETAYYKYQKKQKEEKIRKKAEKLEKQRLQKEKDEAEADETFAIAQHMSHLELSRLRSKLGYLTTFDLDNLIYDDVEVVDPEVRILNEDEQLANEKLDNPSPELIKSLKEQFYINKTLRNKLNTIEPGPAKSVQFVTQRLKHRNRLLEQNLEFGFQDDDFQLEGWTTNDNRCYAIRSRARLSKRSKEKLERRRKMEEDGEATTSWLSHEAETSMRGQITFNETIIGILNVPGPQPEWEFRHAITLFDDRNRLLERQLESVGENPRQGLATMGARRAVYFRELFQFENWDEE